MRHEADELGDLLAAALLARDDEVVGEDLVAAIADEVVEQRRRERKGGAQGEHDQLAQLEAGRGRQPVAVFVEIGEQLLQHPLLVDQLNAAPEPHNSEVMHLVASDLREGGEGVFANLFFFREEVMNRLAIVRMSCRCTANMPNASSA